MSAASRLLFFLTPNNSPPRHLLQHFPKYIQPSTNHHQNYNSFRAISHHPSLQHLTTHCHTKCLMRRQQPLNHHSSLDTRSNDDLSNGTSRHISNFKSNTWPRWRRKQDISSTLTPYMGLMRLDRPIGSWLLFWPCAWSVGLALSANATTPPSSIAAAVHSVALMGVGAVAMRGAGCTINDMWDKDIDGKVERTRSRPLVTNTISRWDALAFLALQLSVGLSVLLQFDWHTVALACPSLGLVIAYPLFKRITYWPQLMLGFTINWGGLLGYSSMVSSLDSTFWMCCIPLYASGIWWTLIYDTIYSHQDRKDDLVIGMKSTALRFESATPIWLTFFSCAMTSCLGLTGVLSHQSWPYYISLAFVSHKLIHQIRTLDTSNPDDCFTKFKSNSQIGAIICAGIWASALWNLFHVSSENDDELMETGNIT